MSGFGCREAETIPLFDAVHVLADDLKGTFLLKLTLYAGEMGRPEFMLVGMKPGLKNFSEGIDWMRQAIQNPLPADQAVLHNNRWWRYHHQLTPVDHFWMPKLKTTLSCDFGELTGKEYLHQTQADGIQTLWRIREAQQLLVFRLNEEGALAQAVFKAAADFLTASGTGALGPKPADPKPLPFLRRRLIFDSPFILALWLKGSEWPYLTVWADSPSVLMK